MISNSRLKYRVGKGGRRNYFSLRHEFIRTDNSLE